MNPYVLFINGPPRAGKDTLRLHLQRTTNGLFRSKFADHLKCMVHYQLGLWHAVNDPDFYDDVKDDQHPDFMGTTPRKAYIHASEVAMKPLYGADIFGKVLVRRQEQLVGEAPMEGFAISDSGFAAEAQPVIDRWGAHNCFLIRIQASRRGCTFDGDSRSYIDLPGIATLDLDNNYPDSPAWLIEAENWVRRQTVIRGAA